MMAFEHINKTLNPKLAKEWHPTKNGSLKPDDVTAYSNKRVWWKSGDNEWMDTIEHRSYGRGKSKTA